MNNKSYLTRAKRSSVESTISQFVPIQGVTDSRFDIFGVNDPTRIASNETGDWVSSSNTDGTINNHHVFITVDSLTTPGNLVITGTVIGEVDGLPISGGSETIFIDETGLYQSIRKFYNITSVNVSSGDITGITYDIGVLGYLDLQKTELITLKVLRIDARTNNNTHDFACVLRKVKNIDDGNKVSLVTLEDFGIFTDLNGSILFDGVRTGSLDRSIDLSPVQIGQNNTSFVFKNTDYEEVFGKEATFNSSNDEGWVLSFEGRTSAGAVGNITAIDHATITITYKERIE